MSESRVVLGVDWLQVVTRHLDLEGFKTLLDFLSSEFEDDFDFAVDRPRFIGRQWDGSGCSVRGIQCALRRDESGNGFIGWISIPGSCWGPLSLDRQWGVIQRLCWTWDARCTRIDLRLDDFSKSLLDLDQIHLAAQQGNFCWANSWEFHSSQKRNSSNPGRSVVFGSAASDKRVTFYDKEVESNGKIPSIRMEVRFRDDRADALFKGFSSLVDDVDGEESWIGSLFDFLKKALLGSVSFIDRSQGDKNLKRCPLLGFWQRFVDFLNGGLRPDRLPPLPRIPSFQASVDWLFRQVSSSLALAYKIFGRSLIESLLSVGESRFSRWHECQLEVFALDAS